mmetsp:Transcript_8534/g.19646  ORF Transcript_8534/g.19646 Transcript_8534/m.19646 type:complete len:302 (+) Transcript_8534:17-922(+)
MLSSHSLQSHPLILATSLAGFLRHRLCAGGRKGLNGLLDVGAKHLLQSDYACQLLLLLAHLGLQKQLPSVGACKRGAQFFDLAALLRRFRLHLHRLRRLHRLACPWASAITQKCLGSLVQVCTQELLELVRFRQALGLCLSLRGSRFSRRLGRLSPGDGCLRPLLCPGRLLLELEHLPASCLHVGMRLCDKILARVALPDPWGCLAIPPCCAQRRLRLGPRSFGRGRTVSGAGRLHSSSMQIPPCCIPHGLSAGHCCFQGKLLIRSLSRLCAYSFKLPASLVTAGLSTCRRSLGQLCTIGG